jgi:hypothetical protein
MHRTKSKKTDIELVLSLLNRILPKQPGHDANPCMLGKHLRMSIVFVGKPEIVLRYGAKPYISYINRVAVDDRIDTFFILARGNRNISVANEVVHTLQETENFRELDHYEDDEILEGKRIRSSYSYLRVNRSNGASKNSPVPADEPMAYSQCKA